MKRMIGMMVVTLLLTGLAQATVYDYTSAGMDGSDWQVQKVDGYFWGALYTAEVGPDYTNFRGILNCAYYGLNRGAMVWEAPVGEYITQIEFKATYNGDQSGFRQVIYTLAPGDALSETTPIAWSETEAGLNKADRVVTFTDASTTSVGLGFTTPGTVYDGWVVGFSDVIITTAAVPEPMTLALLAAGGVAALRRRV
jgi:hypothetical protein